MIHTISPIIDYNIFVNIYVLSDLVSHFQEKNCYVQDDSRMESLNNVRILITWKCTGVFEHPWISHEGEMETFCDQEADRSGHAFCEGIATITCSICGRYIESATAHKNIEVTFHEP
jgi:hypothetical protein